MRCCSNGGQNKTHGTVEKTPRIDSFELGNGKEWILCGHKVIDTFVIPGSDRCELCLPRQYPLQRPEIIRVRLSEKPNGYGGSQRFFLCPACGRRVRYLYWTGAAFLCRKCAHLNYRSQQETRSDFMYYYHKGMDLVKKRLGPQSWTPDGFDFDCYEPDRPRYMHQSTYRRYLLRFLRYREKHQDRQRAEMAKILGMLKH